MRKGKVVLAQPAAGAPAPAPSRPPAISRAPAPVRGAGEEAAYRASLRFQALLQDYQELLKETEAKKRRLNMEKLRKQRLLAEVKFLRKRFKSMSENPSQTIVCRVRNPAMPLRARSSAWAADAAQHHSHHAMGGSSSRNQPMHPRQDVPSRELPVIDLNEACEPGYEEMDMEDRHGYRAPLAVDRMRRYPMEGDVTAAGPSEVRATAFWDVQNPVARPGKRKISWQDQLALRV